MKHAKPIKKEKLDLVDSLAASLTTAKSAVLVDYSGMNMKSEQTLQNKLKGSGAKMLVAKNTLIRLAAEKAKYPSDFYSDSTLTGQTALVVSNDDPILGVQILGKHMSESELPKWKVGVIEGVFQDSASLSRISKLPPKNELISQVVGGISAPLYGLVGTLSGNIQKLAFILSQIKPANS